MSDHVGPNRVIDGAGDDGGGANRHATTGRATTSGRAVGWLKFRRRRGPWRAASMLVLLAVTAWAVAVTVSGLRAHDELQQARALLSAAELATRDADLATADARLREATTLAGSSSERLHGQLLAPLRVLPVAGPNIRAAAAISDGARDIAAAAAGVVVAARELLEEPSAGDPDTEVPLLARVGDLQPALEHLLVTAVRTTREVEAGGAEGLLTVVKEARIDYLELGGPLIEGADRAAELVGVLPEVLGQDGPRTYLLGAAALSELRGTGGLVGSWALLKADEGRLTVGEFFDIDELEEAATDVAAPSLEYAERYAGFGALRQWRNTNLTPDFPSAAKAMLGLWEAQGGQQLDGVILADTVTFQKLVERSGDLEVPGLPTLTPENTLRVVGVDAYAAFEDADERKAVLGGVAAAAFSRVFEVLEGEDVPATLRTLQQLADGGHLRVHSRDEAVQAVLSRAGVGGELPVVDGEFAAVVVNNVAGNKVDYFTGRQIDHRVELLPGGTTRATIEARFVNYAPTDGYPRYVLGPATDHTEAGDNLSFVTTYCSATCRFDVLRPEVLAGTGEFGLPLADVWLRVPAGEKRTVGYGTTTTDGWRRSGDVAAVEVTHLVQPTLYGTELRLSVVLPDGWTAGPLPEGVELIGDELVWQATTSGTVTRAFQLNPPGSRDGGEGGAR